MHYFEESIQSDGWEEVKDGKYVCGVNISERFSVNHRANGGYLMALITRQLMAFTDKSTTPVITSNFLYSPAIGPAEVVVREMAKSTQFSRYEASLVQEGREVVKTMATFLADDLDCSLNRTEETEPEVEPLEQCVEIPKWPNFTIYDSMDVRLEEASTLWVKGEMRDRSEIKGWIKFREALDFDVCGILVASDTFPPPIMVTEGAASWVPTIEMSVNVRNLPTSQWLKCIFRTKHVTCGLLEEDGELWDESGHLIAISRQIAQFRKL